MKVTVAGREQLLPHRFLPHRFYCLVCGCSLYTIEDLSRNECESCGHWFDRVFCWWIRKGA